MKYTSHILFNLIFKQWGGGGGYCNSSCGGGGGVITHIYYKYCHGFIVHFYYKLDPYGYIIYVPCNIMGGGGGGGVGSCQLL